MGSIASVRCEEVNVMLLNGLLYHKRLKVSVARLANETDVKPQTSYANHSCTIEPAAKAKSGLWAVRLHSFAACFSWMFGCLLANPFGVGRSAPATP
jgi:hypothetical protein